MAFPLRNKRWHGLLWALAAVTLQWLQPGHAAAVSNGPMDIGAEDMNGTLFESVQMTVPKIRQGSTFLTALKGEAISPSGKYDNSKWKFTGDVHLEFDGATLDAQAATAEFVNGLLRSVFVQSGPTRKPVHVIFKTAVLDVDNATVALSDGRIKSIQALGTPTQFSYELKKQAQRVSGRASKIEYDAERDSIKFSGDTWYTDGKSEFSAAFLNYVFGSEFMNAEKVKITGQLEDRVPQIRTPDRATAK